MAGGGKGQNRLHNWAEIDSISFIISVRDQKWQKLAVSRTIKESKQDGLLPAIHNPLANGAIEKAAAIIEGQMQVLTQSEKRSTQEDDR